MFVRVPSSPPSLTVLYPDNPPDPENDDEARADAGVVSVQVDGVEAESHQDHDGVEYFGLVDTNEIFTLSTHFGGC